MGLSSMRNQLIIAILSELDVGVAQNFKTSKISEKMGALVFVWGGACGWGCRQRASQKNDLDFSALFEMVSYCVVVTRG